jgi:hypothetical protein
MEPRDGQTIAMEEYTCPKCSAPSGVWCQTAMGKRTCHIHTSRTRLLTLKLKQESLAFLRKFTADLRTDLENMPSIKIPAKWPYAPGPRIENSES